MVFYPMLCEPHPATDEAVRQLNGTYIFERKYDGIRAIVAITADGQVTIHNRNGVDIAHRYPDIVKNMASYAATVSAKGMIFDGEILVWDPELATDHRDGEWSFPLAHSRDAQSNSVKIAGLARLHPATFVAFDMLYDTVDLRNLPLSSRLEHLRQVRLDDRLGGEGFEVPALHEDDIPQDGPQALALAIEKGWEGLVAKRLDATYSSGRNSAWKKIKPTRSGSFIVMGLEPGNGSRADTFGAAFIGVKTPDGYQAIGKVGSGFKQADLVMLKEMWDNLALVNGSTPPVIEVEFQEITDKGSLRFPVFKGIRTDVLIDDCTRERQLA